MSRRDPEHWLWELSHLPRGESAAEVPDSTLTAYREGRLGEKEARELEKHLVASPWLRARLVAMAGVGVREIRPEVRRKVLAGLGRPRLTSWPLAAAVAAATLGAGLFWFLLSGGPPAPRGELPELEGGIRGAAQARSESAFASSAIAEPGTVVRISLAASPEPLPGLEFALYRKADGRLERIDPADLGLEQGAGAVELSAEAADLVGNRPGRHELVAAMGWRGELPLELSLAPGESVLEALARAGARGALLELELRSSAGDSDRLQEQEERP